jgi:hypothetical protein
VDQGLSILDAEKPIVLLKTDKSNIMKRRVRKIANFFAFNLLFFALYLNFIHKDKVAVVTDPSVHQNAAAFSGTVLVEDPSVYLNKSTEGTAANVAVQPAVKNDETALKLSIN